MDRAKCPYCKLEPADDELEELRLDDGGCCEIECDCGRVYLVVCSISVSYEGRKI
jgi:hypothetical protein